MPSIFDTLSRWTDSRPEKPLFQFLDVAGKITEGYTYESFSNRIEAIAQSLRTRSRFQHNDRILIAFPPGVEMICAFFGCARAGLIPVPVYPPSAYGFQSALYRMAHIAQDCGAAGLLTTAAYHATLTENLTKNGDGNAGAAARIAGLQWLISEELQEPGKPGSHRESEIFFLQYTSGSTSHPKGVIVTHENLIHNSALVVDHATPIAVSWLPQYHDMGLIGYYIYSALTGGTTYGFSPTDFIQRPSLWIESITKYRATATSAPNFAFEYCLRPGRIPAETMETADLSSLQFLMTAAEPVRPATYRRFLQAFQPCGLNPEKFFVAYGLAENTLAVTSYGRNVLSVNRQALALQRVRTTTEVSAIAAAKQLVSCGRPLGDVRLRIVHPDKHVALEEGSVGEIWLGGKSKCEGYWNNPELTKRTFQARIIGDSVHEPTYLRTGDLGFLHNGELYVCGRTKDMIIIRGQNYYPQDIEHVVEDASDLLRKTCVAAFEVEEDDEPALAIVAEVKSVRSVPEIRDIVAAVRNYLNVEAAYVALVAPKSLPKTSSGKIMRQQSKQMWLEGKFKTVAQTARAAGAANESAVVDATSPFERLKTNYNLTGNEPHSLIELGIDSLDLVIFVHEIQEMLKSKGAEQLASQVDIRLIQQITVADLYSLAKLFQYSPEAAILQVRHSLAETLAEHLRAERELMIGDSKLAFRPGRLAVEEPSPSTGDIFLTGGTGFFGPFLLKSLLEQTAGTIYVLIRADNPAHGRQRLWKAFESIGQEAARFQQQFAERVVILCGDLGAARLGLSQETWQMLTGRIHSVYHNGAAVNYVFNYQKMRAANITGTNEILRLAFEGRRKEFNYVSTTFIFGWAVKEVLYETDYNANMELLDFGYSQSKWVAEQIVMDARRQGLPTRIFRPALISPSVLGGGSNLDIAIRLLAFMINHGIGVSALNQVSFMPVDVAAANVVGISNGPDTINQVFHVTRDEYASMPDITDLMTKLTGQQFEMFNLPDFVPEVIKRCTKDDPLFPLLDFLIGSIDNIASMEFKRYDSSTYQRARAASPATMPDPSLEDTVLGILRFLKASGLISARIHAPATRSSAAIEVDSLAAVRGK